MNMNTTLCFIMTSVLCVNWTVEADQLLNEWKNTISYRNNVEINLLSSLVKRLELLENNNIIDLPKFEKRINDLEVEVNELKEYKENMQKKLYSLEQTNQALIEHINKCNREIDVIKRSSLFVLDKQNNNNIRSNNAGARHLLSTAHNNNLQHSGITMNDGTSIRFIQNNDASTVELSHENGVLKLNGTLQLNNDINDVNNAIKDLQSHVSSTTKTIHVPSDYATISAAIASLKSVHYNQVIIQLSPGIYNENIIIDREMAIPKGLVIRGDRVAVGSYIFNVSSGAYAISVTKPINKLLIDGISIEGSGNGIYVEDSHVEIGNVNISTTGEYGIHCTGSQSYLHVLSDSSVSVTCSKYCISVFFLAKAKIDGNLMIDGLDSIANVGIYLFHGSSLTFRDSIVTIKDCRNGIALSQGSELYQRDQSTMLLNILHCKYGFQVTYGSKMDLTYGTTNISISSDGFAGINIHSSVVSADLISINTAQSSSAASAVVASYNSVVVLGSQNSISASNWGTSAYDVSYGSVLVCSSNCPAQGNGINMADVSKLGMYRRFDTAYCSSADNSCTAVPNA